MNTFRMKTRVACFAILIASSFPVSAGPVRGSWDEVRILEKGQQLQITTRDNQTHKGTFRGLDKESLLFLADGNERAIPKAEIRRVGVKANRRVKNMLIGAGIGLGLGIVFDQTLGQHARNETGQTVAARSALIGVPAGIGALSALIPSYRTVYLAPK